jgi:ABC-type sugar transport system permease subunit
MSLTSGARAGEQFVGLLNFTVVFRDPLFVKAIWHNIQLFAIVPVLIVLSLVFATILYERIRGWRLYRVFLFVPVVLSVAAIGIAFGELLQLNGPVNELLRAVGLEGWRRDWLGDARYALVSVGTIITWKEVGFGTVLFLAKLMSVDRALYEAAEIDGASWWQKMRHVTVPQLAHVIEFYAVLMAITAMSFVFDYIFVITNGGPSNATIVGEYFIYRTGFVHNRMDLAAAVSAVYLFVGVIFMVVRARLSRGLEEM